MEETGHYYTVYFTSLAVGFNEKIAYRHAVLAQMPDEVGWLDAANMQERQCLNLKEYDLNSKNAAVPPGLRFNTQYVLHSLPSKTGGNKNSADQQAMTRNLLRKESPLSLEFGLLLHRLGDTYSHSKMGNEKVMYTVSPPESFVQCTTRDSTGHGSAGSKPDYPYLRIALFEKYVTDLYTVLNEKARQRQYADYTRKVSPRLLEEVKSIFTKIMKDENDFIRFSVWARFSEERAQAFFIQRIREQSIKMLGVTMKPYAPERIAKQTLAEFLLEVKELDSMDISERSLNDAFRFINHDLEKAAGQLIQK